MDINLEKDKVTFWYHLRLVNKMKIAFLSSIYPAHAEKIYRDNPNLKDKSSDEQMEFIRWHALSSFVRWNEML